MPRLRLCGPEDGFRFDLSCYESHHLVTSGEGVLRLPTLAERERLLGFDDNYPSQGLHPKIKGEERQCLVKHITGGTFLVFTVMVLLDELLSAYGSTCARQKHQKPSFFTRGVAPTCWTERPVFVKQSKGSVEVAQLVTHFLRFAENGGVDVHIDAGSPFRAQAWPRSGIQSQLFNWAIDCYCSRVPVATCVELQAVVNSIKWRMWRSDNLYHRVMLLLDSQVVCAIIS